ncbi:MAG: UvrB/UvrC motif-containing protein [Bacillota bacterium]|nr:UvrB/UvrC motif-containing protein [Bacillota bacterium]
MLCQWCQKRPASVHFTQVVNNNKVEMYLCEQCAKEKGQVTFGSPFSISDFLSGIMEFASDNGYRIQSEPRVICEKCGMTYEEFQKSGKLGCGSCYELYHDKLDLLLKRLHGNAVHCGKSPGSKQQGMALTQPKQANEIDGLKELLNKAIQNEEYEKAAEIRDRIKNLEAKQNKPV